MRVLISAAACAAALACGGSDGYGDGAAAPPPSACTAATATATTSISLSGNQFVPACARVSPGGTATFTNEDAELHTVTTDAGQPEQFDSGDLSPGAQFAHVFGSAGTVRLHCNRHPGMNGTVVVE